MALILFFILLISLIFIGWKYIQSSDDQKEGIALTIKSVEEIDFPYEITMNYLEETEALVSNPNIKKGTETHHSAFQNGEASMRIVYGAGKEREEILIAYLDSNLKRLNVKIFFEQKENELILHVTENSSYTENQEAIILPMQ
ncbi:hypothetical protein SAMN05421736_12026 [Evansella caseinilytica]|uniref:Uncharacterized protein n=1 Tax=Evansella caseinilytica TaxID=1503961 RepID=A0A1H3UE42_9BACI|nr:hypothetical protein [Evansella caseinilytica]SDZ59919.1 hypothetical protein SAMN05421736_12026 [Evansella caseinilytica]